MIRKEIKQIVDNIDKFKSNVDYKFEYKKIRIDALWEKLDIDQNRIKLSFREKRYLFKPFIKIVKENEKHLKNCENQIEEKLLKSINFEEL